MALTHNLTVSPLKPSDMVNEKDFESTLIRFTWGVGFNEPIQAMMNMAYLTEWLAIHDIEYDIRMFTNQIVIMNFQDFKDIDLAMNTFEHERNT